VFVVVMVTGELVARGMASVAGVSEKAGVSLVWEKERIGGTPILCMKFDEKYPSLQRKMITMNAKMPPARAKVAHHRFSMV
jgi:hypothetical protein